MLKVLVTLIIVKTSTESCGKQFSNDPRHTQGGRNAFDPWVVSLGRHEEDDYKHECTGAILTKRIVITAGHCLENRNDLVVRAGRNNPRHIRSIERKIKAHIYHPKYDQRTFYYDVALVFLDRDLDFSIFVGSICLPDSSFSSIKSFVGDGLVVQGWSSLQAGLELSEIDVIIKSQDECNFKYESSPKDDYEYYLPEKLKKIQFCAGNFDTDIRTYYGDSGGPAFRRRWSPTEGESFELIGIVSGGFRFADNLYAFIAHEEILTWIKQVIRVEEEARKNNENNEVKTKLSANNHNPSSIPTEMANCRQEIVERFPNSLDNHKICEKVRKEGKFLDWMRENRSLCEDSSDHYNFFIQNSCSTIFCSNSAARTDEWNRDYAAQCSEIDRVNQKMCKNIENNLKAYKFLNCDN